MRAIWGTKRALLAQKICAKGNNGIILIGKKKCQGMQTTPKKCFTVLKGKWSMQRFYSWKKKSSAVLSDKAGTRLYDYVILSETEPTLRMMDDTH